MRLSTLAAAAIVMFIGVTGDLALSAAAAQAHAPATTAAAVHTGITAARPTARHVMHADPFILGH